MAELHIGMYVRCATDDQIYNRDFASGKIIDIDYFSEQAEVEFYDIDNISAFYPKPENKTYPLDKLTHCKIHDGSKAIYGNRKYTILSSMKDKETGNYLYYIQSKNNDIEKVSETDIECTYNSGYVSPLEQLRTYEFQNHMWYMGRSVVSKTTNIINNSLYGFSDVAGCKIYLKTHQLRTIIRCVQEGTCRNMIADEVGMGKTIEAAAILKVFLKDHYNSNILIVVPDSLVEQWRTELAYKFKILEGRDARNNRINLIGMSQIGIYSGKCKFDFIIADEVHKYLKYSHMYKCLLDLSMHTENILMLSATPVQKRRGEYKKLLQLIQPQKYINMSDEKFNMLMDLQTDVVRRVYETLEDLDSYMEEIEDNQNEHTDDTEDAFDDVIESLGRIGKLINDETFVKICENINYNDEDFGISRIEEAISYTCENYQLEKSIIRNRRSSDDEDYNVRSLEDISYDMQTNFNNTEYNVYQKLASWIEEQDIEYDEFLNNYKEIVSAFFSSAKAFNSRLNLSSNLKIPYGLKDIAEIWENEEKKNVGKIKKLLDDPDKHSSRMVNIIDYIDQELDGKKVIIFTNFDETFDIYKKALTTYFGRNHCAFFAKRMNTDERELNAYRFETDDNYNILLSDESGGEGRNFQNADALIHVDIPWSANDIEQRIGRLDRIGREEDKDVLSIVSYAKLSLEEDLFNFWDKGIGIFRNSQSGLEIIMNDMDEKIINAVCKDFKYGLINIIDDVVNEIEDLKKVVIRERYFDIAEYKYKIINKFMDDTIDKYEMNEKELFASSMMKWASLSGFKGSREGEQMVRFNASSFSIASAYRSLFIPPDINLMIEDKINQLQNKVRSMNDEKKIETDVNYIQGTFDREYAINNDYIHFFAPGDEIYDSIVNSALNSYKGTCTAFECESDIKWVGFVFTWEIVPDKNILLENGISLHAIDKYRGFMPVEQIQCAVPLLANNEYSEEEALSRFNYLLTSPEVNRHNFKHLGSRGNHNIDRFISANPKERWENIVAFGNKKAHLMVREKINKILSKQIGLLKAELIKDNNAQESKLEFFGEKNSKAVNINNLIYESFKNPKLKLDSVCYVRMIDG